MSDLNKSPNSTKRKFDDIVLESTKAVDARQFLDNLTIDEMDDIISRRSILDYVESKSKDPLPVCEFRRAFLVELLTHYLQIYRNNIPLIRAVLSCYAYLPPYVIASLYDLYDYIYPDYNLVTITRIDGNYRPLIESLSYFSHITVDITEQAKRLTIPTQDTQTTTSFDYYPDKYTEWSYYRNININKLQFIKELILKMYNTGHALSCVKTSDARTFLKYFLEKEAGRRRVMIILCMREKQVEAKQAEDKKGLTRMSELIRIYKEFEEANEAVSKRIETLGEYTEYNVKVLDGMRDRRIRTTYDNYKN